MQPSPRLTKRYAPGGRAVLPLVLPVTLVGGLDAIAATRRAWTRTGVLLAATHYVLARVVTDLDRAAAGDKAAAARVRRFLRHVEPDGRYQRGVQMPGRPGRTRDEGK